MYHELEVVYSPSFDQVHLALYRESYEVQCESIAANRTWAEAVLCCPKRWSSGATSSDSVKVGNRSNMDGHQIKMSGQTGDSMEQLPLSGYTVLDLSRYGPGPYCSMLLSDLGANVTVVDDGTPRDARGRRAATNSVEDLTAPLDYMRRNARRIALDLKHPDGKQVVQRLVAQADVLIESFRPGVAARLGLGYEELSERHPRLVYCSISGYGQDGPYRDRQGHDINYLALGGLLGLTGEPAGDPILPGTLVADLAGGGLPAAVAILGALLARERSGKGRYIDVSLQDGIVALLSPMIALAQAGWPAGRGTGVLSGGAPWYRVYRTADDRHVAVGAIEPWLFAELCRRLERPDWIDQQFDRSAWPEMQREMSTIFAGRTMDEWRDLLEDAGVCVTGVSTLDEMMRDPQLMERGTLGPQPAVADNIRSLPVMVTDPPRRAPSQPGADADEVLASLGFDEEERQRLRESGGVA